MLDPAKPLWKEQRSHFFADQLATVAPQQCELDTALSIEVGLFTSARSNGAASASGMSGGTTSALPDIAARDASDAGCYEQHGRCVWPWCRRYSLCPV